MRRFAIPAVALAAAVPAVALAAGGPKITGHGAGGVKLGADFKQLRHQGKVGPKRPGCELSGPGVFSAKLKPPLVGTADLTRRTPRKIKRVIITGGTANAKGVKVGSSIATIESAFANVQVDHSTEHLFKLTLYKVPKPSGTKFEFGVSTKTHKVTLIGIPVIPFCE